MAFTDTFFFFDDMGTANPLNRWLGSGKGTAFT
jgi:hypothetical protein